MTYTGQEAKWRISLQDKVSTARRGTQWKTQEDKTEMRIGQLLGCPSPTLGSALPDVWHQAKPQMNIYIYIYTYNTSHTSVLQLWYGVAKPTQNTAWTFTHSYTPHAYPQTYRLNPWLTHGLTPRITDSFTHLLTDSFTPSHRSMHRISHWCTPDSLTHAHQARLR